MSDTLNNLLSKMNAVRNELTSPSANRLPNDFERQMISVLHDAMVKMRVMESGIKGAWRTASIRTDERDGCRRRARKLEQENANLRRDKKGLQEEVQALTKERDGILTDSVNISSERANMRRERDKALEDLEHVKRVRDQLQWEVKALRNELHDARFWLNEARKSAAGEAQMNNQRSKELNAVRKELEAARRELDVVTEQRDRMCGERDLARENKDVARVNVDIYEAERVRVRNECTRLQARVEELEAQVITLEEDLKKAHADSSLGGMTFYVSCSAADIADALIGIVKQREVFDARGVGDGADPIC